MISPRISPQRAVKELNREGLLWGTSPWLLSLNEDTWCKPIFA